MIAVAATRAVTDVVGYTLEMIVLVLVGVGTSKQEQANETAFAASPLRQSGVGTADLVDVALYVEVDDDLLLVVA